MEIYKSYFQSDIDEDFEIIEHLNMKEKLLFIELLKYEPLVEILEKNR